MPVVAIVEDDDAVREALSDLLAVLNVSYRSFDRAASFLSAYAPGQFDCLITDMSMPGLSGLALLQRLRALGSSMPVIIITAAIDPTTRARALEGGVHAFLTKPVNDDDLIRYLKSALNRESMPGSNGQEPGHA
jgi:two-component system, LuxR family, response regulator FixJ